MKITIKLLSDLCTASGETHNSMVDTDIVYDEYGIPYIPAKRIKGCIREAALEMMEMGLIEQLQYLKIFGKEGNQRSGFSLSNAYIQDYDKTVQILRALHSSKAKGLSLQQNVLNEYADTRTQTAIDLETGVADKNSLRTIRVARKGLILEADCNIINPENFKVLQQAVSLVKHMGVSRSRGLGLVDMRLDKISHSERPHVKVNKAQLKEYNKLRYKIYLKSAMICKSAQGNQAVSEDYIAGSKVLGVIAELLGSEKYRKVMSEGEELIVSNAYITYGGKRCIPGRSSLQKKKDQSWASDGVMDVWDMLYEESRKATAGIQMTPANIDYISTDGRKVDVETEISYHHQRPENKSVGRATGKNDGSGFYQLCSIRAGQTFSGYIYANKHQAEVILDALERAGEIRMGYGRSSEFGAVDLVVDEIAEDKVNDVTKAGQYESDKYVHDAVITLVSDAILYNEHGIPTTEISEFVKYLRKVLRVEDIELANGVSPYLKFVTTGGFNVTWGKRKPIHQTLGKGSTFMIHSDIGMCMEDLKDIFVGERVSEGFGEILAEKQRDAKILVRKPESRDKSANVALDDSEEIVQKLLLAEFGRRMQGTVRTCVKEKSKFYEQNKNGLNAAIVKLRGIYRDVPDYQEMLSQVEGIEKDDKNKLCTEIVRNVNPDQIKKMIEQEMLEEYGMRVVLPWSDSQLYKQTYRAYITELKYFVKKLEDHSRKVQEGGEGNGRKL